MARIVTVLGATGIQGGSIVAALLNNPAYTIRAVTRNSHSDAAKSLKAKGVSVVEADLDSVESLKSAFAGTYAIFAVTNFFEALSAKGIEESAKNETRQGINLADAAAATESLEHYIWSTLPNSRQNSGGQQVVPYYESKNKVDDYIKSIPRLFTKTTFLWLGWYAGNMASPVYKPNPITMIDGSTSYIQIQGIPSSTLIPSLGDEKKNPGLFVQAILDQPQKTLPHKIVVGVVEELAIGDVLTSFASAQNIKVQYVQVPREEYAKLWSVWGELIDKSHSYLKLTGSKAFSNVEGDVITKESLNIEGLVGTSEAFKSMPHMF